MRNADCGIRKTEEDKTRARGLNSAFRFLQSAIRLVASFLLAAILGAGCSSESASGNLATEPEIGGPTLENVSARVFNGSDLETVVQATRAVYDMRAKADRLNLSFVQVAFYDKGAPRGEMSGDKGVLYLAPDANEKVEKDDLLLSGNVRVTLADGSSVSAPEFRYLSKDQTLVSGGGRFEQRFKTPSGWMIVTGERFRTNKAMTRIVWENSQMKMQKPATE